MGGLAALRPLDLSISAGKAGAEADLHVLIWFHFIVNKF
jgi:hypothetical protein